MSFLDALRNPLPSTVVTEAPVAEEPTNTPAEPVTEPVVEGAEDINNIVIDDGDDDTIEGEFVDDLEKPDNLELTPEEEAEADSIINIAATPVILKEVLTQEAVDAFVESAEFDMAIEEGFALEGTKDNFGSFTGELFTEAKFYNKNQVRFTKEARTNQLFEICVQAIARAKNDPVYFKLAKVQVLRRKLKATLRQRYKAPAMKKAKEYIVRLRRSKAPTIANAAKKIG